MLVEGKILLAVYALRDADDSLAEQLRARLRCLNLRLACWQISMIRACQSHRFG